MYCTPCNNYILLPLSFPTFAQINFHRLAEDLGQLTVEEIAQIRLLAVLEHEPGLVLCVVVEALGTTRGAGEPDLLVGRLLVDHVRSVWAQP